MTKRRFFRLLKSFNRAPEVLNCIRCTGQWKDLIFAYLGLKSLSFPYNFETRHGQKITINTFHDLVTVWVIFCRHEYKIPKDTSVVIDAGANIGTFSIYASGKNVKEIFAIEPFPDTYSQLEKNIKRNGLENKVKLNSLALANETGTRNMDLSDGPSQSRGLLEDQDKSGLTVTTSTLADFLNTIGKDEIDFLKIDIEGGEHEVFHSSTTETLRRIKYIAMEYHPDASKSDLFNKITQAQFKLTHDYAISSASGVAYFKRL